jgi:peptidoglycan hydrolase-like protein with peptidoglycan-binding domain
MKKRKKAKPLKRGRKISGGKGKIKASRVFIYALAVAALGGGGFLVYDKLRKKKFAAQNQFPADASSDTIIINNSLPVSYSASNVTRAGTANATDNFPLKRGSRGARVRLLQQALSKTTPSIMIDGIFGPQTASALKSAGYSETVDEILFNKITGVTGQSIQIVFNPSALAASLYKMAQAKNLDGVLSGLRHLKTVSDYSSVNEYYKKQSFISRTIVTDLLDYAFKYNDSAKSAIKNEFMRIGLKVNDEGTWSLQGIRLFKDIITIRATVVTDSQNNKIPVRRNTILGDEMEVANGMTWFKSIDNSILKVPSQDVKYT